jgi:hypothetical protein
LVGFKPIDFEQNPQAVLDAAEAARKLNEEKENPYIPLPSDEQFS